MPNRKVHGDAVEIVQMVNGQKAEKILGERIVKIQIKHHHHHLGDLRVF
jgi:hypothetical protein